MRIYLKIQKGSDLLGINAEQKMQLIVHTNGRR
jgi:hypothetical protein